MKKITVTFQEEGAASTTLELPAQISIILDKFIQDSLTTDAEGQTVPKYNGKADLFLKHMQESLLEPLSKRYANVIAQDVTDQIAQLEKQKIDLELSIKSLLVPKIL